MAYYRYHTAVSPTSICTQDCRQGGRTVLTLLIFHLESLYRPARARQLHPSQRRHTHSRVRLLLTSPPSGPQRQRASLAQPSRRHRSRSLEGKLRSLGCAVQEGRWTMMTMTTTILADPWMTAGRRLSSARMPLPSIKRGALRCRVPGAVRVSDER